MKLSDVLPAATRLAREKQEFWEIELPKRHPDYPLVRPGAEDGPPPPQEKQLADLLRQLPGDVIYKLALLMYVGRGLFSTTELAAGAEQVRSWYRRPVSATGVMLETASLADYWTEGLAKLRLAGIAPDDLPSKPMKVRK